MGSGAAGLEGQLRVGAVGAFGVQRDRYRTRFWSPVGQNLGRMAALGYGLNFYWDGQRPSQMTGSFGITVDQFSLFMENDFLAGRSKDRYRTGAIALVYPREAVYIALQHLAWTADPYREGTRTATDRDQYPQARYGYRHLGQQPYQSRSAGILALRALYRRPGGPTLGAALGIDAEQIRHTIQNRWIHNTIKNPHIPMIDTQGQPYRFGPHQKIRAPRCYGELLLNPTDFF